MVADKKTGLIAEPNAHSIAKKIEEYFELGEDFFLPQLREEKKKFSWENMVKAILKV
jgi:glycosyltransferase involved in cell wall biosynthesis